MPEVLARLPLTSLELHGCKLGVPAASIPFGSASLHHSIRNAGMPHVLRALAPTLKVSTPRQLAGPWKGDQMAGQ